MPPHPNVTFTRIRWWHRYADTLKYLFTSRLGDARQAAIHPVHVPAHDDVPPRTWFRCTSCRTATTLADSRTGPTLKCCKDGYWMPDATLAPRHVRFLAKHGWL